MKAFTVICANKSVLPRVQERTRIWPTPLPPPSTSKTTVDSMKTLHNKNAIDDSLISLTDETTIKRKTLDGASMGNQDEWQNSEDFSVYIGC